MSLLVASHQKVDTTVSWGHPVILVRWLICVPVCECAEGKEQRPCRVCSLGMRIIDICTFIFFVFQVLTSPTFSFKGKPDPGN